MDQDTLAVRMARLEGAYEQIDRRLGTIEGQLHRLVEGLATLDGAYDQMNRRMGSLEGQMTRLWYTVLGAWFTLALAMFVRRGP